MGAGRGHERSLSSLPLLPYSTDSPPPSPSVPFRTRSIFHRRRFIFVSCAFLSFVAIVGLAVSSIDRSSLSFGLIASDREQDNVQSSLPTYPALDLPSQNTNGSSPLHEGAVPHEVVDEPESELEQPKYSPYLRGPPTNSFRENLRSDMKYITSWISAGWNNDVMTYMNLLYLGKITDRVSVIGTFTPSHIGGDAPPIPFGEVFNVSRFIQLSNVPMVEWDEVKDPDSPTIDAIGCWNVWEAVQYYEHYPRHSFIPDWVGLDISYTRGPDWLKLIPNYEHDKCSTFWALARLAYPEDRSKSLTTPAPSPHFNITLPPDEHMLCYDYMYYACAQQSFEYEYDYAPQWKDIGTHLRWSDHVTNLAALYVKQLLGYPVGGETPAYITIHARHGDFNSMCWQAETPEDCFAPLSVIALRVREIQDELRQRKGIDVPNENVIMTSDEKDETWWDDVKAMGWVRVDHDALNTVQQHGRWYPVVLDAAIQANGMGFVGTDRSTFSILSMRRVNDWQDGASRMVKWGKKDADMHRRRTLSEST